MFCAAHGLLRCEHIECAVEETRRAAVADTQTDHRADGPEQDQAATEKK